MSGFGGSTAWKAAIADSLITRLFSETDGCGLTLDRMHINTDGTAGAGEVTIAKKAQSLGAYIWGAPWSPPAEWKDNGDVNNGGHLQTSHYQDWADRLASFVKLMATSGIDIKWVSAQNEPNWTATYESCIYTEAQMVSFVGQYLGPTFAKAGLKTKIIAPETINWCSIKSYGDAILNNDSALKYTDVIATHSYGCTPPSAPNFPYKLIGQKGKGFWETEHGMDNYAGDETMTGGIPLADEMHSQIVHGPLSAYHVWWIIPGDGPNGTASNGLLMRGHVCQRGYVMGNYSRFVRPGSYRIAANDNPSTGIYVTAYRNDSLGRLIVVAINENKSATQQNFVLKGVNVATVIPWETSDAVKLTARAAVTAGTSFSWSLPAMSVVSFVGSIPTRVSKDRQETIAVRNQNWNFTFDRNSLNASIQEKGGFTVAVYSLQGVCVGSSAAVGPGKCRIPLRTEAVGMYLVKVSNAENRSFGELVIRR